MSENNGTFTAMAKELREGETISRSFRMVLEGMGPKDASKKLNKMRNSMNQLAARARDTTGFGYRVESGQFMTHDGSAVMLTCTLTCMEDEGEDDI